MGTISSFAIYMITVRVVGAIIDVGVHAIKKRI